MRGREKRADDKECVHFPWVPQSDMNDYHRFDRQSRGQRRGEVAFDSGDAPFCSFFRPMNAESPLESAREEKPNPRASHCKVQGDRHTVRASLFCLLFTFLIGFLPSQASAQIRTVYVIPSSHWDRGFVTSPEELLPRLKPHIDEVIDDAAADPDFRWTIESVWQLNEWLKRTYQPERIALLRDMIKRGQIELSASYGSMHTEFMGSEELNLITQDGFRMSRRLGVDLPSLAMMDDVPGFTERLPQVLASSGVGYFLNGSNLFIGGGTTVAPGNVPFYWEGQDGSRVLTWVSEGKSGGYVEGMIDYYLAPTTPDPYAPTRPVIPKELQGKPPLEVMDIGMKKLLEAYEKASYKYDAVLVMYLHDFVPPSDEKDHLLPMVRKWNASGRQPQIRVATPKEFFTYVLSKYGSQIPTYRGDWSGLWSQVKTNSPGISSVAREAQMELRAGSLLWGGLRLKFGVGVPSGNFLEDYRRLWNYDEHSGAGQVGWPGLMTVQEVNDQNREYVEYVRDASNDESWAIDAALRRAVENPTKRTQVGGDNRASDVLTVFQPLSWKATSLISVPKSAEFEHAGALRDLASGTRFPIQWTEASGVAAAPLSPTGVTVFEPVDRAGANSVAPQQATLPQLENQFYRVELRASDGAVAHLIDRESGEEIVNTAARDGFNQMIPSAGFARTEVPASPVTFRTVHGPVFDAIEVLRTASYEPITEYRLYDTIKRVEIRDLLDRARLPVVAPGDQPNVFQFSFPLLPGAAIESFQYENGNGLVTFPQDYLPGSRRDAVVTHGLAFSTGDFHVTLSSPQAFYWDLPNRDPKSWKLLDNALLSSVWRKEDAGETRDVGVYLFPTVEPGLVDRRCFVYELTSWTGPKRNGETYRRIWETIMPPSATTARAEADRSKEVEGSFFTTDDSDVVVLAAEPSLTHEGAVVLRLQETSGTSHRTRVTLPATGLEATQVDLTEAPLGSGRIPLTGNQLELQVGGHATISILLVRPAK